MSSTKSIKKKLGVLIFLSVPFFIASFFNACGRIGTPSVVMSESDVLGLGKAACDAELQQVFSSTYHPFLKQNCNSCHSNAQGSADTSIAFKSFMQKGVNLIDYQSTHSHGGNSLGAHIQPSIDAFKANWNLGQEEYVTCLARSGPSGMSVGLMTKEQALPGILTTLPATGQTTSNVWVKVQWDLSQDLARGSSDPNFNKFQSILEMEAKFMLFGGQAVGFQFRNPTLKLKNSTDASVEVSGIQFYIDGVLQDNVTTYLNIIGEASSTTASPLAANLGAAIAYYENVGLYNKVALGITGIRHTSSGAAPAPTPTPTPAPTPTPMAGITFNQLISADQNLGVFTKYCTGCHGAVNPKGGLNLLDYNQASLQANSILNRMNDSANPMPPSGIVAQQYRDVVNQWITGGKKQQ